MGLFCTHRRPRPAARPVLALCPLEDREVPAGFTFTPSTGLLRVDMAGLTAHGPADARYHTFLMSASGGRVVLDDGAGNPKPAYNTATRRLEPVPVAGVRRVEVVGSGRRDEVGLAAVTAARGFNLTGGVRVDGNGGNDGIKGSGFADTITGGAGADRLHGSDGNDSLDGGTGNDSLTGGAGRDTLRGGAGDDYLYLAADAADDADGGGGFNRVFDWRNQAHRIVNVQKRL